MPLADGVRGRLLNKVGLGSYYSSWVGDQWGAVWEACRCADLMAVREVGTSPQSFLQADCRPIAFVRVSVAQQHNTQEKEE